ncbi:MAG: hypothetical protein WBA39_26750 [Rivularia sp. (in: cyanobacteria)]
MDLTTLIAFIGLGLTILTLTTSIIISVVNAEKRKYGLERDFAHMKRDYKQMTVNLSAIMTELDHRFDTVDRILIEIKLFLKNENH